MAHQAHTIPWGSLASNFIYSKDTHGVYDIRPRNEPDQPLSLRHFAKIFAQTIRDYSAIERKKYAPAAEYKARARTWKHSDRQADDERRPVAAEAPRRKNKHPPRTKETRKLYSDQEAALFRARQSAYGHGFPRSPETQYIDNWIAGEKHWLSTPDNGRHWGQVRDEWVTYWTDDWKMLMLEAALLTTPLHERAAKRKEEDPAHLKHLETLFLLAHHPDIPLADWTHEGDACCNFESGLVCLVEGVLMGYMFINLIVAMRETGSPLCQLTTKVQPIEDRNYRRLLNWASQPLAKPRPAYMGTPGWYNLLETINLCHDHHWHLVAFAPFLYPHEGENFTILPRPPPFAESRLHCSWDGIGLEEADILTPAQPGPEAEVPTDPLRMRGSPEALHEFLRGLWKMLVHAEMLWNAMDRPLSWEKMVADMLMKSFLARSQDFYELFFDDFQQYVDFDGELFEMDKSDWKPRYKATLQPCERNKAHNHERKREANRQARRTDQSQNACRMSGGLRNPSTADKQPREL